MLKQSLALTALLLFVCGDSHARHPVASAHPPVGLVKTADTGISMHEAVERVRKQTGGRVLDAQQQNGQYRIKVLTPKGEVRVYRVDARTGAVR